MERCRCLFAPFSLHAAHNELAAPKHRYYHGSIRFRAMGIDKEIIEQIVQRVLSVAKPDKIILFGSAATGAMTSDSDIDLLIVEASPGDRRKESVRIDATLSGLGYPFDVIVIATDWFEASKGIIGGIAYPANKYGRVIYEAA